MIVLDLGEVVAGLRQTILSRLPSPIRQGMLIGLSWQSVLVSVVSSR